jgi:pimeloyl-ACP methyl ester carboxylesterase
MNETTAILRPPPTKSSALWKRRAILHVTNWLLVLSITQIATFLLWSHSIIRCLLMVLWSLLALYFCLTCHGMVIWYRGEQPIDACCEDGGRRVTTSDGRTVEYFSWGSQSSDAVVTVLCHGQAMTGSGFNKFLCPDIVLKELNVRAISPSYPGHGLSGMLPFRKIANWPKDDLEPILKAEKVDRFMVQGYSYGTSHAMATAAYFGPERCVACALIAPYLPKDICREFGFHTDADMVLNEDWVQSPWIAPLFSLFTLLWRYTMKHMMKVMSLIAEGKVVMENDPEIIEEMEKDCLRCASRGINGQVYEILNGDTNQVWQDPRTIQTKCVAVWYAKDDTQCPPAHGKWLADMFEENPNVKTSIRCEEIGWGHFTYVGKKDRDNAVATRALLELLKDGVGSPSGIWNSSVSSYLKNSS